MNITRAAQRACKTFTLGLAAVAAAMGVGPKVLANKLNPDYPEAHLSPEQLVEVMEITKDISPLIAMADQLGFVLVKNPCALSDTEGDCNILMAGCIKEFGEFICEVAKAAQDGQIKGNELRRIEAEGPEALAAIQCLMAWAAKQHESGKPAHLRAA